MGCVLFVGARIWVVGQSVGGPAHLCSVRSSILAFFINDSMGPVVSLLSLSSSALMIDVKSLLAFEWSSRQAASFLFFVVSRVLRRAFALSGIVAVGVFEDAGIVGSWGEVFADDNIVFQGEQGKCN